VPSKRHHRYYQVFDDMQRELVLMTKPKHRNVLMVHGMYVRRTRLTLGRPV
jgi:hypothetical protein